MAPWYFCNSRKFLRNKYFTFSRTSYIEVLKETNKLDASKTNQEDIPTKLIRKKADVFAHFLRNKMIVKSVFPAVLKLADITPVFKRGSQTLWLF